METNRSFHYISFNVEEEVKVNAISSYTCFSSQDANICLSIKQIHLSGYMKDVEDSKVSLWGTLCPSVQDIFRTGA